MAELKNEGIPYCMYGDDVNVKPVTWGGKPIPTRTLDYLAPNFLSAVKTWYAQVMPILSERLCSKGGPVIAVQLDNEIGMLSWVSNSPDLTDVVLEDFRAWSSNRYGDAVATVRGGADSTDALAWAAAIRNPVDASLPMHHDLGLYMRDRFRRYVLTLRGYAEEFKVDSVPFLVNIHGTGGGRGRTFQIGISQLFEAYRNQPQMTSGSDIYLGDLTVTNVADLYMLNAFMDAVHGKDQPTSSLEFEAGNGNYGKDLGSLYTPEAIELKTRLCLAQGLRLLNYYLHAGGENPHIESAGDGIDRIAFTGQTHGFAAPVEPNGRTNDTYDAITRVVTSVKAVSDVLANSREEHDSFAFGFVPDQYLTEYHHPDSKQRTAQIADLERFRGYGPRDILARALVLSGFSFPAVNLQDGVPTAATVVLPTGRTLPANVQEHLAEYVRRGGNLLLVGLLPDRDLDGAPCTVLADSLGLKSAGVVEDAVGPKGPYWPTVAAHNWASPRPEMRVSIAQLLSSSDGAALSPLLSEVATGLPCAVERIVGRGKAIVLGCDYPPDLDFYRGLMERLAVMRRWYTDSEAPGLVLTSTVSKNGQRLLHLLNVAPAAVTCSLTLQGRKVFGSKHIEVPARTGLMLPFGVKISGGVIESSTAELLKMTSRSITVRPTQDHDVIVLKTKRQVSCTDGSVRRRGARVEIRLSRFEYSGRPVKITLTGPSKPC